MNTTNTPASGNGTGLPVPDATTAAKTVLDTQDALGKALEVVELVRAAAASGEADDKAITTGAWIAFEMLETVRQNLEEITPFILAVRDGKAVAA